MPLYKDDNFVVERESVTKIKLTVKNTVTPCSIQAEIEPHDNRIVINAIELSELLPNQQKIAETAIEVFCNVLREQFGGKQFVCLSGPQAATYQGFFRNAGFSDAIQKGQEPGTHMDRVRITTPTAILDGIQTSPQLQLPVPLSLPAGFTLEILTELTLPDRAAILSLMRTCNFTQEKIKDYLSKGEIGVEVMQAHSAIAMIRDPSEQIVAYVRCSNYGRGIGYIADTLVHPKAFGEPETRSRKIGTALLYEKAFDSQDSKWREQFREILLIAPLNRVEEFERNFGCKRLCDLEQLRLGSETVWCLGRFALPQAELKKTYAELVEQLPSTHAGNDTSPPQPKM